jgi:DNA-directed RNA polymerase subunit alpha
MNQQGFDVLCRVAQLRDSLNSIEPGAFTPAEALSLSNALLRLGHAVQAEVEDDFVLFLKAAAEEDRVRGLLATPIGDLNLSKRAYRILRYENIETLGDLVIMTPEGLLGIRGFGQGSLMKVCNKLEALGLSLCQEPLADSEEDEF